MASPSRKRVEPKPRPVKATLRRTRPADAHVAKLAERVEEISRALDVQFTRIAQLQADIDLIRGAWAKVPTAPRE